MLKDQLLDQYELKEIFLLVKLYINDGQMDRQTLMKVLDISAANLKKTVDSVNFRLEAYCKNKVIEFHRTNNTYALTNEGYINLGGVVNQYAATSVNFLIVRMYLENEIVYPDSLINHLLISRADLYRRIKKINQVLQEFSLQIKNNRLRGPELQFRYFEQLFYQTIFSEDYLIYKELANNQFEQLFKRLENYYQAELDSVQKAKLSLWFSNLLKNIRKKRNVVPIPSSIAQYLKENPYYQELSILLMVFFKKFNIKLKEIDKISTYLFFQSFFVMPISSEKTREMVQFSLKRKDVVGQTIQVMNQQTEEMLANLNEPQIRNFFYLYYLFNCHNQAIFFKGYLFHVDSTLLHFYQSYNHKEIVVRNWIENLCQDARFQETFIERNKEFLFHKYMLYVYHEITLVNLPLRVGVSLFTDPLMELMVVERLQIDLSKEHNVRVERYQETHSYDLVVVNVPNLLEKNNFELEFTISGMGTPKDRYRISKKLAKLQQERLAFKCQ